MLARRAKKFVSNDTLSTFTFPTNNLLDAPKFRLLVPMEQTLGGDFSLPFNLANQNPIGNVEHSISFLMVSTAVPPTAIDLDTSLDAMYATIVRGAVGKLYTTDDNAVERWAYAVCTSIADPTGPENRYTKNVSVTFQRISHWFVTTSSSAAVTASGQVVVVNNPGHIDCYNAIWTITPTNASPLANNPLLTFSSAPTINGVSQFWQYNTGTGTALNATTRRLLVNTGDATAKVSTNSGSTYTDDYAHLTRQTGQAMFSQLIPGNNNITIGDGGTPHYTLSWSLDAPYLR